MIDPNTCMIIIIVIIIFSLFPIVTWIAYGIVGVKGLSDMIKSSAGKKQRESYAREMGARGLTEYNGYWGTFEDIQRWRAIGLDNNFADYSPYEFEKLIGKLFTKMGYDTQVTQKSKDYGIDVIAKKDNVTIAIQVKKYSHGTLVSNTDIQQTLGAMWKIKAEQAILVTTSRFTVHAKEQAKDAPIELWDKEILHNMIRKYFIENESTKFSP